MGGGAESSSGRREFVVTRLSEQDEEDQVKATRKTKAEAQEGQNRRMTHVVTNGAGGTNGRGRASPGNSYEAVEENINVYLGIFRQLNSHFFCFCQMAKIMDYCYR